MIPGRRGLCAALFACSIGVAAQGQAPPDPGAELIRQAQEKQRDGRTDDAIATFRQAAQVSPKSFVAHYQLGLLLDLAGDYASARKHLALAMQVADAPQKAQAERAM